MMKSHPNHPRSAHRGVALVLVLVALAIGLLLTATWLDGRRESVPVAERVSDATSARHAAASGLDLAIATLDAEDDWRAAVEAGRLDGSFEFEDATLGFTLSNADDGGSIDSDTLRITIRSRAVVAGIAATCEGFMEFEPEAPIVDLGYGETAIIVDREIRILDRAAVLPWRDEDGSDTSPVVLGTLDGDPQGIELGPEALLPSAETILVRDPRRRARAETSNQTRELPESLPPLAAPNLPEPDASRSGGRQVIRIDSPPHQDLFHRAARIPQNATLRIQGDRTIKILRDLDIEAGARLVIDGGTLHLDVERDVDIRHAEILVGPTGRLVIRAGRRLRIDDAYIGDAAFGPEARAEVDMLPPDTKATADRIILTALPEAEILISGESLVTATIVAPDARARVVDDAVMYGRMVASRVELRDDALLYARPDDGSLIGLTTIAGPHRDEAGFLNPLLTSPDRNCPSVLQQIAESMGIAVCSAGSVAYPSDASLQAQADCIEDGLQRLREDLRSSNQRSRMRWILVENHER